MLRIDCTEGEKFEKTLLLEGDVYSVEMQDTSGSHIDNLAHQKVMTHPPA
jgi:hypothetical protein